MIFSCFETEFIDRLIVFPSQGINARVLATGQDRHAVIFVHRLLELAHHLRNLLVRASAEETIRTNFVTTALLEHTTMATNILGRMRFFPLKVGIGCSGTLVVSCFNGRDADSGGTPLA